MHSNAKKPPLPEINQLRSWNEKNSFQDRSWFISGRGGFFGFSCWRQETDWRSDEDTHMITDISKYARRDHKIIEKNHSGLLLHIVRLSSQLRVQQYTCAKKSHPTHRSIWTLHLSSCSITFIKGQSHSSPNTETIVQISWTTPPLPVGDEWDGP